MNDQLIKLLLADDDQDDCMLFKDALEEIPLKTQLHTVTDGEKLMTYLQTETELPDVLFLDLNMPKKNGLECLSEIRSLEKLKDLPVIIFSTSFNPDIVRKLYDIGAHHYIRKPNDFTHLKKVIHSGVSSLVANGNVKSGADHFVLKP